MIPLFLGLSAANILVLGLTFGAGLLAAGPATALPSSGYAFHITIGIAAGLMTTLTHTAVYTYFMATSKWLQAATDKADLDPTVFVAPAKSRKHRILSTVIAALVITILTMFAGAAADPTAQPWLPSIIHMLMGLTTLAVNLLAAVAQFPLVQQQGRLIDQALAILNDRPNVRLDHV